ncbi:hypothetical protein TIFTF001_002554 [Ficus carica]|uniref:Uncharacterized protein n=1 Tax=Ficus carica TaxID=3494 RepID=A0AA88D813_FICCA|nr:hypothetical protein TIFTF001_002554 [Ficus carica]
MRQMHGGRGTWLCDVQAMVGFATRVAGYVKGRAASRDLLCHGSLLQGMHAVWDHGSERRKGGPWRWTFGWWGSPVPGVLKN